LPNPVPAAQMVYNHVARAIQPSFEGFANSFPTTVNAGDAHVVNFLFILHVSNSFILKTNFFGYRPNTTAVAPAVIPPVVNNKRNRSVKPNVYTLPAGAPVTRSFNFNPNPDLPESS
jgi:hypothetical protein